jgi:antitoxin component of RelBE/YafQ-DinJ toxin-antitoxin module
MENREVKKEQVGAVISLEVKEEFKKIISSKGLKMGFVIEELLKEYIKNNSSNNKK